LFLLGAPQGKPPRAALGIFVPILNLFGIAPLFGINIPAEGTRAPRVKKGIWRRHAF
jgi:hypothetical protein